MKRFHQACAITILTVLLSAPVFAGQVNSPGVVDPPPPPPPTETTATSSIATTVILVITSLIR
jgi:hypothetical protein